MCATLGHDLLVSRAVADNLSDKVSKQPLGSHALKGKAEPVEIVAVND
jgi:class 3 adenylate cyclase